MEQNNWKVELQGKDAHITNFEVYKQYLIHFNNQNLLEQIEGLRKECKMCSNFSSSEVGHDLHIHTYNQALDDIKNLLIKKI